MKRLFILLFSIVMAGEMTVDGDLKVTGTVDANGNPITNVGVPLSMTDAINGNVLQDVLRDDGVYEFKLINFNGGYEATQGSYTSTYAIYDNNTSNYANLTQYLNTLSQQGWSIIFVSNNYMMLRKPIVE